MRLLRKRCIEANSYLSSVLARLEKYRGGAVSGPDVVRIMSAAFDDTWKSIEDSGITFTSERHANATRELLALRIIEMAEFGECDQRRLRDDALLYLAKSNVRS